MTRRLPVGAEPVAGGADRAHFRVWAPKRKSVEVIIGDRAVPLAADGEYFAGCVDSAPAGTRYRLRLDGDRVAPDPASRYQPDGPHGDSIVIDPERFEWTDAGWRGVPQRAHVIYEMHVGTFTPEGTWRAAMQQLTELAALGITTLEILPVADFPGRFGWGYDGVALFAPFHDYGVPDDFRAFVDAAHAAGLGVILDVVYNHFGPDGNYLREFSDWYFSDHHVTDWGDAINFDDRGSAGVREFILANVRHWITEYHLDGLRLDATQNIYDESRPHIFAQIGAVARECAAGKEVLLVAENEPQDATLVRPEDRGGYGLDMLWCDDFHHTAVVAATGRREAYFTDYRGTAQEFVSAFKHGNLYQGQHYRWQKRRRGGPAWDMQRWQFLFYIENHDQMANTRDGRRLWQLTSPGRYRTLTAILLLAPQTPMLFQGQEFGASSPFLYFADHTPELNARVREGRAKFMAQFASLDSAAAGEALADPADRRTFERSKIDHGERARHPQTLALHRDLLRVRRENPVLTQRTTRIDGAVLDERAFVIRYFGEGDDDRLLVVNLGEDMTPEIVPEPLLAPVDQRQGWRRIWHSEGPAYGGRDAAPLEQEDGSWRIPAESATLLAAS